ncbi:MAG: prolipoprotein diacylglyceryl transferase [Candidatus Omnitrophica bacterium]|nr:prolipoprotein diacylglyceryl transferase [Candidatus Omnitrophota bacterium]
MHPLLFKFGPFTVYAYGFMVAVAYIVGVYLATIKARQEKLNPEIIFNLSFIVFIAGIIGARLFYVLENLAYYIDNPLEIIMLHHGGLAWFGGFIFGVFFGIVYLKKKRIPVLATFDLIVPYLSLSQAIGRVGCLLNGCCFGKEAEWGIYFIVHRKFLIPTQMFSSLILLIIFIALRFYQDKPHRTGRIFFAYLILYSLKRFFIEFLRADNPVVFYSLTLFQLLSIGLFLLGLAGFLFVRESK